MRGFFRRKRARAQDHTNHAEEIQALQLLSNRYLGMLKLTDDVQRRLYEVFSENSDLDTLKQEIFRDILQWVKSSTRGSSGQVFLVTSDGTSKSLVLDAAIQEGNENTEPKRKHFATDAGITGHSYTTGKAIIVPDVAYDANFIPLTSPDTRSELAIPLVRGKEIFGVLNMESSAIDNYALSDVELIEFAAGQITLVLSFLTLAQEVRNGTQLMVEDRRLASATLSSTPHSTSLPHPRVFVSYSHTDIEFVERLVQDIEHAGARPWLDRTDVRDGSFVARINEGLKNSDWCVVVLSPDALHSKAVDFEVNGAIELWLRDRLLGVIPIIAKQVQNDEIPALWGQLQRYDSAHDYHEALASLIAALGLTAK